MLVYPPVFQENIALLLGETCFDALRVGKAPCFLRSKGLKCKLLKDVKESAGFSIVPHNINQRSSAGYHQTQTDLGHGTQACKKIKSKLLPFAEAFKFIKAQETKTIACLT